MFVNLKYKQVIILRSDINMKKGKMVAQGCHASIIAYEQGLKLNPSIVKKWRKEGQRKIALKVDSEEKLLQIYQDAKTRGLPTSLVADAGLTQLEPGTKTAIGIGPGVSVEIDKITGKLKLL